MQKPRFLSFVFILSLSVLIGCDNEDTTDIDPDEFPEGEIWATIDNTFFRFNSVGTLRPPDANGYAADNKFTNITREATGEFFGIAQLRLLRLDLDAQAFPVEVSDGFTFTFRPSPNVAFVGRDESMQLTLTGFEDNVLEGTFSGRARNLDSPGESFLIREGRFKIRLVRF